MNYQSIATLSTLLSLTLLTACTLGTPKTHYVGCNNFVCQRDLVLKNARASYRRPSQRKKIARKVEFTKIKLQNSDDGDGLWTGFVHGNGLARLRMNFIENGRVTARRYIGSVQLEPSEDPTFFRFKSQLPESDRVSWNIVNY